MPNWGLIAIISHSDLLLEGIQIDILWYQHFPVLQIIWLHCGIAMDTSNNKSIMIVFDEQENIYGTFTAGKPAFKMTQAQGDIKEQDVC